MPAAESDPETADTTADEAPKLTPLELVQQARAKRTPPPGVGDPGARGGKGRGVNPRAPRHYNRHK